VVEDLPIVMQDVEARIIIDFNENLTQRIIDIDSIMEQSVYKINNPFGISFVSSKVLHNTMVFVHFYDNSIYVLPSQSSMIISYNDIPYSVYVTGINLDDNLVMASGFIGDKKNNFVELYENEKLSFFASEL